jgi:hypothetical protein
MMAAVLALAVIGCGSGADDADAAKRMEVGVQDDAVIVEGDYYDRDKALRAARKFGATRLRINVTWAFSLTRAQREATKKPANLQYQFGLVDAAINAAAQRGMRVYLTLTGPAPAWATSNGEVGPRKPNVADFAQFASRAANHFKGRVDRYAIWNEPNIKRWLAPLSSAPSQYRRLYQAGYAKIKEADPNAEVLFGELSPYSMFFRSTGKFATAPLAFLRKALCVNGKYRGRRSSCPKLEADGFAHHPYDFRHAPTYKYPGKDNVTIGTLSRLTRALNKLAAAGALRKAGGGKLPLHLTEYGYFGSGPRALPKARRGPYLSQGWKIALRHPRVKGVYQYLIAAPPRGSPGDFFDLAILSTSGRKRPTYNALVRWYRKYKNKVQRSSGPIALPSARP